MTKLNPLQFDKVWGYELWIASTHPDGCQKDFQAVAGTDYPLLVKIIQADNTLSVQVHPDDEAAVRLEGPLSRGKTECWYVLDAQPGAKLVYGLSGTYSQQELAAAIAENKLESYLNYTTVKKGDFIFIPSGTVHAIGAGLRLLEVQQSCNITYRLYDWGRPRELHIEKGLQVIKNHAMDAITQFPETFTCPYFSLSRTTVNGGYAYIADTMHLLFVTSGAGTIQATASHGSKTAPYQFSAEQIFTVLPGEKITIEGKAELMKIVANAL
jgi:mannose-6-phosphate isomerase